MIAGRAGTVMDALAPDIPTRYRRAAEPMPELQQEATDQTHVLVAGRARRPDGRAIRAALDTLWRAEGRPLHVLHPLTPDGIVACWWATAHELHGVTCALTEPTTRLDVVLLVGPPSAALRGALPLARQAGIRVVHAGLEVTCAP